MRSSHTLFIVCFLLNSALSQELIQAKWSDLIKENRFSKTKQSFCIENGSFTSSKNINLSVRPASVSKLYTTLWSFEKLGHKHRYKTVFKIKDNQLYIIGARDPFFVTENLLAIMGELEDKGYSHFDKVVIDKNVLFNWSQDPLKIKSSLYNVFNSSSWSRALRETFTQTEDFIANYGLPLKLPSSFQVDEVNFQDNITEEGLTDLLSHESSTLLDHFKQVNIYSNNFYSDQIFNSLGGESAFNSYIKQRFSLRDNDTHFFTGSGLGENRTTCSTSLKVLKSLKSYAQTHQLKLTDFVSVAGVDAGTLRNRFKGSYLNKVIAKTGTLRHTSTLAGYLGEKQDTFFGVFNHSYEKEKARSLQNDFIKFIIDEKALKAFQYKKKDYISILDIQL